MEGKMQKQVVITGRGIISSIGQNLAEFSKSLREGRSGIGNLLDTNDQSISVNIGAKIRDFSFDSALQKYSSLSEEIVKKAKRFARRSPFAIQTSVAAVMEAWEESGLYRGDIPSERLGIIVAGSNVSQNAQYEIFKKFHSTPEYVTPTYALHFMDTDQVGTLSEIFNIHGDGFTVGGASASGNVGLIRAYQLLQHGYLDACIVVGSLADLSPIEIQAFVNIGAMGGKHFHDQPEKACRPFDEAHEGFIYGQASGCMVLETMESARRREARVIAEILGGSLVLDGNRLSDPSEQGETKAMLLALERAGIKASEVDYINTHGTASPLGDETEVKAIRNVFKDTLSKVWINSTKGLTGHCLFAAGMVEAISTVVQIEQGFVHPNKNLDKPIDSECRFCGQNSSDADIKIALSNSFGFGGINTSIILKKGDK